MQLVSKIITGPQSTTNLMLGEKSVLPFKMEQSPSSCKPGLHCEKPRSTAQSCLLLQFMEFFAHQGQLQKERDSPLCWRLWKLHHISCASAQEQMLWWGKQVCSRTPGTATDPCCALQVAVCWSCAVSRLLFKPRWSISGGVHHHQWGIMVIAQEQNPCADTTVSTRCPWRVYNLQLNLTSADQKGSTLR